MLQLSIAVFFLQRPRFSRFGFPRWQAWAAVALLGALIGLDPAMRSGDMPMPLWMAILLGLATTVVIYLTVVYCLAWWLRRGGRWDGEGDIYNLVACAWLLPNLLGAGAGFLGLSPYLAMLIWVYSLVVGVNALTAAVPRLSWPYALAGICISLVVGFLLVALTGGLLTALLLGLGWVSPG